MGTVVLTQEFADSRVCWVEAKIVQCFLKRWEKKQKIYLWSCEVIINLKWFFEKQQKKLYKNRLSTWPLDLKIGPPSWSLATTYATAMGPGGTTPPNGSTRPKSEGDGELAGLSTALYSPFFLGALPDKGFCWGEKCCPLDSCALGRSIFADQRNFIAVKTSSNRGSCCKNINKSIQ